MLARYCGIEGWAGNKRGFSFSIKNNLPYFISEISVLLLVYDKTGTVVDYQEHTYFNNSYLGFREEEKGIKPYLAHTIESENDIYYDIGYELKARILNYKIKE